MKWHVQRKSRDDQAVVEEQHGVAVRRRVADNVEELGQVLDEATLVGDNALKSCQHETVFSYFLRTSRAGNFIQNAFVNAASARFSFV